MRFARPQSLDMLRVDSEPGIFRFSPEALSATVGAISELCGIRTTQVPELVAARPSMLIEVRSLTQYPVNSCESPPGCLIDRSLTCCGFIS